MHWFCCVWKWIFGRKAVYWVVEINALENKNGRAVSIKCKPKTQGPYGRFAELIIHDGGYSILSSTTKGSISLGRVESVDFYRLEDNTYRMHIREKHPDRPDKTGMEFWIESDDLLTRVRETFGAFEGWAKKLNTHIM